MRNLQLLFALFLLPFMVQSQNTLFIKYDSSCMDRYEYQLGDNPNVKSFVTYSIKANRNEKVVLEVGIESIKMQSKLPSGAKLKNCKSLKFNQRLVNRINNQEVKVYMVREIGGKYNLSTVSIASLSREANGELTFIGNNYNFTFNPTKHSTGDNLSGKNSDSDIFYHGKEPYQCSEAIKFQRIPIEICCCSFTDLVYVPKIGMIMEQGGNPSEGTKENALNLRAINNVPFGQYMADACAPPSAPVEEVVVAREAAAPVSYEQTAPPAEPTVNYGLIVAQEAPPKKAVAFVPYELMVVEQTPEIQPVNYGVIKQKESEPVPYEIVTTVTKDGDIPKPCVGEVSAGTHIVQPGESLYGIARMYGANVKNLQTWNQLKKEEIIHPCTRLYVVPPPSSNTVTETFASRNVAPVNYEETQERIVLCNEISTERAHVVQQGENLLKIARQYGLTLEQLKAWNNIKDVNTLEPCSKLIIKANDPVTYDRIVLKEEVVPVSRCSEQSTQGIHVVQPNENLTQIANLYGLSLQQIRAWNGLTDKDVISVCTKLRLVPNMPTSYEVITERVVPQSRCEEQSTPGIHVVQPNENLTQIADLYNLNIQQLREWNKLTDKDVISVCTKLRLVPTIPTSYEVVTKAVVPQSRCAEQSTQGIHVVQPKENLTQIADLYGLSIQQLREWNGLTDKDVLSTCTKLRLVPNVPTSYEVLTEKVVPQSRCAEQSTQGIHVVQPKENLTQIADLYGLSVKQLRDWNGLADKDVISVCTKLRLVPNMPTSYDVVTERIAPQSRCAEQSTQGIHVVQPKENLTQIASLYGLSVNNLKKWNSIKDDTNIPICTKLRLVPVAPTPATYETTTERVIPESKCPQSSMPGMHIVQPKETLNQIAVMYDLSIEQLRAWNNINDKNVISVCSQLRLVPPAPKSYEVVTERIVQNPVPAPKRCEELSTPGTHVVQPKETLNQIADLYGLSLQDLRKWNKLTSVDNIPACSKLSLVAPVPTSYEYTKKGVEKCNEKSTKGQHVVQSGETLYSISKKYKVTIKDLQAWNGLGNTTYLAPCMKVFTKRPASYGQTKKTPINVSPTQTRIIERETVVVPSIPMDCNAKSSDGIHVVKKGDSLYSLSKKYNVSIAQLQSMNGLGSSENIVPCMKLITKETKPKGAVKSYEVVTSKRLVPTEQPKAPVAKPQPTEVLTTRSTTYNTSIKCPESKIPGIHVVKFNETLTNISNLYGISIAQLKAWNGIKDGDILKVCTPLSIIRPDSYEVKTQRINVPETTTTKSGVPNTTTIVIPSTKEEMQPKSFNQPTNRTTINVPSTQTTGDGRRVHVVRDGETIESIARTYQIAPERLRSANLMDEKELITPGQKLYLN